MPHCDLRTGQIFGCEYGTLEYFHEQGHLEFNKHPSLSKVSLITEYLMYIWMLSITLIINNFLKSFSQFISIATLVFIFYFWIHEEFWAHSYAKAKLKEMETNQQKEEIK